MDLHIHSPGSLDYENSDVTPNNIIEKAIENKLDLIAITDHNTVDYCYEVINVAKGKPLIVIPGVEISCQGGRQSIHLLALFDCKTSKNKISDMLTRIGIPSDKRGREEALTDKTISQILDEIQKSGGMAIAAHSDSNNGMTNDIRGQQRVRLLQNEKLFGLEIVDKNTSKIFNGTDTTYRRKLPCIQGSDSHSLSEIGRRFTLLKMDKPCLEGIRQAFLDQESRIRMDEPQLLPYPYIVGMYVNGGFLDDQVIQFNKNLNCLIGGRGTGKSTIIELIRFCLDALSPSKTIRDRRLEMVNNVLGSGVVGVFVQTKEGIRYKIERRFGDIPHVYNVDSEEIAVNPALIFPIVSYGETEIEQISYDISSQLELVDKFSQGLCELKIKEETILNALQKTADDIISTKKSISEEETRLKDLPEINEMLKVLKKYKFDVKLENQQKRAEEKSLLAKIEESCLEISENLKSSTLVDDLVQVLDELPSNDSLEKMPNKRTLRNAINQFKRLYSHVKTNFEKEERYVDTIVERINKVSIELKMKHERQEKTTLRLFAKLEAEGESDAATKYLSLQNKKLHLKTLVSKVKKIKRRINQLEVKRTKLLDELKATRQVIFKKRKICADSLSDMLGPKISILIEKGKNTNQYFTILKKALKGSRVQSKDIKNIVKNLSPFEFFEIVQEKKVDDLVKKINITDHWAQAVVHFEPLREKLFEIQQVPLPDMPRILLEVGGEKKSLDNTSLGQKCTTLLSLIMLESELPLIVDTPEEGLDNIFVYDSVVNNLRSIKEKRQLILATHNANIPVLGDSELIFYLESDGKKGWISCRASIDEEEMKDKVQQVLEGGKEAFMIRKRKYGY